MRPVEARTLFKAGEPLIGQLAEGSTQGDTSGNQQLLHHIVEDRATPVLDGTSSWDSYVCYSRPDGSFIECASANPTPPPSSGPSVASLPTGSPRGPPTPQRASGSHMLDSGGMRTSADFTAWLPKNSTICVSGMRNLWEERIQVGQQHVLAVPQMISPPPPAPRLRRPSHGTPPHSGRQDSARQLTPGRSSDGHRAVAPQDGTTPSPRLDHNQILFAPRSTSKSKPQVIDEKQPLVAGSPVDTEVADSHDFCEDSLAASSTVMFEEKLRRVPVIPRLNLGEMQRHPEQTPEARTIDSSRTIDSGTSDDEASGMDGSRDVSVPLNQHPVPTPMRRAPVSIPRLNLGALRPQLSTGADTKHLDYSFGKDPGATGSSSIAYDQPSLAHDMEYPLDNSPRAAHNNIRPSLTTESNANYQTPPRSPARPSPTNFVTQNAGSSMGHLRDVPSILVSPQDASVSVTDSVGITPRSPISPSRGITSGDFHGMRGDLDSPSAVYSVQIVQLLILVVTHGAGPVLVNWATGTMGQRSVDANLPFLAVSIVIASKASCAGFSIVHVIQQDARRASGTEHLRTVFDCRALRPWVVCASCQAIADLTEIIACQRLSAVAYLVCSQVGLVLAALFLRIVYDLRQTSLQWSVLFTICLTIVAWWVTSAGQDLESIYGAFLRDRVGLALAFFKALLAVACGVLNPRLPVPYAVQHAHSALLACLAALALWPISASAEEWQGNNLFAGWNFRVVLVFLFYTCRDFFSHCGSINIRAHSKNICSAVAVVTAYGTCTLWLHLMAWSSIEALLTAILAMEVVHYSLSKA